MRLAYQGGEAFEERRLMEVRVDCDAQVGHEADLIRRVEGVIGGTLERFQSRISRVEAFLRDLHSAKPGARDLVCSLEARMAGGAAVLATYEAATLAEAIHGAADKLERLIARNLQQLDEALHNPHTDPSARSL
jgi:ribosome-associated translation inhibitor RaiA